MLHRRLIVICDRTSRRNESTCVPCFKRVNGMSVERKVCFSHWRLLSLVVIVCTGIEWRFFNINNFKLFPYDAGPPLYLLGRGAVVSLRNLKHQQRNAATSPHSFGVASTTVFHVSFSFHLLSLSGRILSIQSSLADRPLMFVLVSLFLVCPPVSFYCRQRSIIMSS